MERNFHYRISFSHESRFKYCLGSNLATKVKHDNVTKSMQVKDCSLKVLRFQQITDASFLSSKGLHWKM